MNTTSIRLLGAALGATAIVGASTVAANACDLGGHHGTQGAFSSAAAFSHERGEGHDGGHHSGDWRQHWGQHDAVSFEQKQAAIVERLTSADERLSAWIEKARAAATADPDGSAAAHLGALQQRQADLASLIDAVQAATDEDELKAAFADARSGGDAPAVSGSDAGDTDPAPATLPVA